MKTLYAYCPSCKAQARVDSFAGMTSYLRHKRLNGKPCRMSLQACFYKARDWHAGMPTDDRTSTTAD
jgi:hypothetical protein